MKIIYFFLIFFSLTINSQNKFIIYYSETMYNIELNTFLKENKNFNKYNIMTQHYIDPKNEGVIDLTSVKKYLIKRFPNFTDKGVLCVNIENKIYKDLLLNNSGNIYRESIKEFRTLIRYIKEIRPNLEVGIYGIPYRFFYDAQKKWNSKNKFNKIIREVDIIFPSLYILYPKKQTSLKSNLNYLRKNLDEALNYGVRFNKKVIPFFGYTVHYGNNKYRSELLSFEEVKLYLDFIENYSYKNEKVSGVVWWDIATSRFLKSVKIPHNFDKEVYILKKEYLFTQYLSKYLK